jgi:hypothetical protein
MNIVAGVDSVPNPIPIKAESNFKGVHIKVDKNTTIIDEEKENSNSTSDNNSTL